MPTTQNLLSHTDRQRLLVRHLAGTKCSCGKTKKEGKSFCPVCFAKLERPDQVALYRKIGNGYEEAYAKAKGVLGHG